MFWAAPLREVAPSYPIKYYMINIERWVIYEFWFF